MESPIPQQQNEEVKVEQVYNFTDAFKKMVEGGRISRTGWQDKEEYGFVKDGIVMIHTKGKDHQWIISEGDYISEDWIIV